LASAFSARSLHDALPILLARVGVRAICIRRLTALDVPASEFVLLSPRLSLLAEDMERAATTALQRRVRLVIRDFPVCVAPRLRRDRKSTRLNSSHLGISY